MIEHIGQQFGNYQITRLVGKGGFADVYVGEHIYLKNQVALKILHARSEDVDVDMFLYEGRILVKLIHPHIIRLLDFGIEHDTPFLVMDYASHGTLRQRHPSGTRVPLALVVKYVNQVASALQYAHDQKMVHRDVKPENMLLDKNDEVLLGDFGVAVIAQSATFSHFKAQERTAGTIAYMAPEQIQAEPVPASDQYSLAVVAYEWLSGTRPFTGTLTEIAVKHALTAPPPLHTHVTDLPPAVEQVIMTALAKAPEDRFASVQAFANALEQAAQSPIDSADAATVPMVTPMPGPNGAAVSPVLLHTGNQASPLYPPQVNAAPVHPQPLNGNRGGPISPLPFHGSMDGGQPSPAPGAAYLAGPARVSVTPIPPAPRTLWGPGEANRPGRNRALLIGILLLLVLLLSAGAIMLLARNPGSSSGKAVATLAPQVTAHATPNTAPTATPTSAPTATPTPVPTATPVPTEPPVASFPVLAKHYSGNIHNDNASIDSTMTLQVNQDQGNISGQFTVNQPLSGNGPFTGSVDKQYNIQFLVHSPDAAAPLFFQGTIRADRSMVGSYCSVNASQQCDPAVGGHGTWQVQPDAG